MCVVFWSSSISSLTACVCCLCVCVVSLLMVCIGVFDSGLSLRSAAVPPLGQSSSLIPTNRKSWLTTVAYCKSTTTRATSGVLTHACTYTHNLLCLHPVVVTLRNVVGSQHHLAHMVTGFHFCFLFICVFIWSCAACV